MNALIKLKDGQIAGWVFGDDVDDLRFQLSGNLDGDVREMAKILDNTDSLPYGKHDLGDGNWLLKS